MKRIIGLIGLASAFSLAGQPLLLEGPLTGFLFDNRVGAVRPIVGVPGAAYVSEALVDGLQWASVGPRGAALALKDGVLYRIRGLNRRAPEWAQIEGAQITPDRAAWSADGATAVVYSSESGQAQRIRGFGTAPAASEPVLLGAGLSVLAIDPQERILAGFDNGLYVLAPDAAPSLVAAVVRPVAVAILGSRLVVAGASGEILEVQDYAGNPRTMALGTVPDPVGLALSEDGGSLYVASRSERAVEIYDLAARTVAARLELEAEPATLEPLSAQAAFLLRRPVEEFDPLWVLKAGPEPGVWFVPVARGE